MRPSRKIPEGQDPLPFRNGNRSLFAYALPWEKRFLSGLAATFLILAALYVYFVMASIVHAAARQELLGKVATAQTAVSVLENQYIQKTQDLTESYAHSLGFVTVPQNAYVVKQTGVALHDVR